MGPAGAITGPFTVTPNPLGRPTPTRPPRTYRIGFPTQRSAAPTRSPRARASSRQNGNALDTNLNAGRRPAPGDRHRADHAGHRTPTRAPRPTAIARRQDDVVSTLNVPDNFLDPGRDGPAQHHPPERPRPRGRPWSRPTGRTVLLVRRTSGRPARRPTSPTRSSTTRRRPRSRTAARRSSAGSSPQQPLSAVQRQERGRAPGSS